jgi:hypothetical protein
MEQIRKRPVERVGVLVVHGIGEQRRFEHLESEARKVVNAILAKYGTRRCDVTVTLTFGASDSFHGDQCSWVAGREAPLHALVDLEDEGKVVDVAFHEVWWADVNERLTLWKQVRFWFWGLSIAGVASYYPETKPGNKPGNLVYPPSSGRLTCLQRIRLFLIAISFGLSAFSIAFVNFILKRLDFKPVLSTDTVVNYLSGVKLFAQHSRAGGGPMDGPDEPPRFGIRRRMVRAMVDAATAGYDRWYILAHSLGGIVAWNGLMAEEEVLPNYLDQVRWKCVHATRFAGRSPNRIHVNEAQPNRPVWLGSRETIVRKALFEKFRGILTYGCPLERFGVLWPKMVPTNPDNAFPPQAEWINVYDPTDPVGTWIENFGPIGTGSAVFEVNNFPCRASPVLLLSHICYLNASRRSSLRLIPDTSDLLVKQVAEWLVKGGSLAARIRNAKRGSASFWMPLRAGESRPGWQAKVRAWGSYVQWAIIDIVLTFLALWSLHWVVYPFLRWIYPKFPSGPPTSSVKEAMGLWVKEAAWLWAVLFVIVLFASWVHYRLSSRDRDKLTQGNQEQEKMPPARAVEP